VCLVRPEDERHTHLVGRRRILVVAGAGDELAAAHRTTFHLAPKLVQLALLAIAITQRIARRWRLVKR
jgi:hypothetical protein